MSLKLMYITNDPGVAVIAEESGVDWIFIDLEIMGKEKRQGHLDTVISRHQASDVKKLRESINRSEILVRINPYYVGTPDEIEEVVSNGADIIMLPYFKTRSEVESFIAAVDGRVKTCLLCETPKAVSRIDDILTLPGIDCIHIGLNDLHLGYGMRFMFELLTDGTVEMLCGKLKAAGISYGFGGIARLGEGTLPAEYILAEHYRLGSSMVILSRSFCNISNLKDNAKISRIFQSGIEELRNNELALESKGSAFFEQNRLKVKEKVFEIINA